MAYFFAFFIDRARLVLESNISQNAVLRFGIGSEKLWKLWLNTTMFSSESEYIDEMGYYYSIPVQLQAGPNKILIKLVQHENTGLNFPFQITDTEGNPISGVKFQSASEVLGSGKGQ